MCPAPARSPLSQSQQLLGREVLSGSVERVVFHNPDTGFSVLRVQIRGLQGTQAVVGLAGAIRPGEWITATGEWVKDRTHGRQFEASHLRTTSPESEAGIERYMASGAMPGIGRVYAKKLVAAFGSQVFDIIEKEPERLREVPGIGRVRARRIVEAWNDQAVVREIMIFLHGHGVGPTRAAQIYREYGADTVQTLSRNPYRLCWDIRGIGFAIADSIALKLGIDRSAEVRIRAGVNHALEEALKDGHCGLPLRQLLSSASQLLGVSREVVRPALASEVEEGTVIEDEIDGEPCAFLAKLHRAERGIARDFANLAAGPPPWPAVNAERAISWFEANSGLKLAPEQQAAVQSALNSKAMIITGGPGVGKTTLLNAILTILSVKDVEICLCAPTGRAAKRMAETSGYEARTIHRLLEFDPGSRAFRRDANCPLECDLLVVDETSMVDVPLMRALLKALPRSSALLLVGDADQLPSVGPGRVLGDLIDSGAVPVARLVEVFRQGSNSKIVANAHKVNAGRMPDLTRPEGDSDFYFVPAASTELAVSRTVELVAKRIPGRFGFDPVREIQVLCPMNRGSAGTTALNAELQAALVPAGAERLERRGRQYAVGDKVMQVENDYDREIFNGDIGTVKSIDVAGVQLRVDFDGRPVDYSTRDLDSLRTAFAITIHKSQGSEYPAVVIPLLDQHYVMLRRNLIYTAITRGKRLVVLVGQRSAVRRAVRNTAELRRWSTLRGALGELRRD